MQPRLIGFFKHHPFPYVVAFEIDRFAENGDVLVKQVGRFKAENLLCVRPLKAGNTLKSVIDTITREYRKRTREEDPKLIGGEQMKRRSIRIAESAASEQEKILARTGGDIEIVPDEKDPPEPRCAVCGGPTVLGVCTPCRVGSKPAKVSVIVKRHVTHEVTEALIHRSKWFSVTPLPNDMFEIEAKDEPGLPDIFSPLDPAKEAERPEEEV
jgi:hypothetical protein